MELPSLQKGIFAFSWYTRRKMAINDHSLIYSVHFGSRDIRFFPSESLYCTLRQDF